MSFTTFATSVGGIKPHTHLQSDRQDFGPDDLSDVIDHFIFSPGVLKQFEEDLLSAEDIRKTIKIAFLTSLRSEEGRYPTCSLLWPLKINKWPLVGTFSQKKNLDITTLSKLAAIAPTSAASIVMEKNANGLQLTGLANIRYEGLNFNLTQPDLGLSVVSLPPGCFIRILGPGHLRVEIFGCDIELRGGCLMQCHSLWRVPHVADLMERFANACHAVLIEPHDGTASLGIRNEWKFDTVGKVLLEAILRPIVSGGHGGTIVVVPKAKYESFKKVFDLGTSMESLNLQDFVVEYLRTWASSSSSPEEQAALGVKIPWLHQLICSRGRMMAAARNVGALASVDGCVVLDDSLSVKHFGARINVTEKNAEDSSIQFMDENNEPIDLKTLTKNGGTRHRSALWLCKAMPNVVAFVVSQDQHLKVISSGDYSANAVGPIVFPTIGSYLDP